MNRAVTPDAPPALSAVLCTRERPEQLCRALHSLAEQEEAPDQLLVIDNAPAGDETLRAVTRARSLLGCDVEYILEPIAGLDVARNRALRCARGEIVAFLDDDAVAHRDWVRETRRAFTESPELAICMGRVDALPPLTPGARLFESNGGFGRGHRPIHLPRDAGWKPRIAWSIALGSGCSMAVRRDVVLRWGGFDEALDTADGLPGGDLDLIRRALEAGAEVHYEPRVRALHEHRRDLDAVVEQIARHNRGLIAMLAKAAGETRGRRRAAILLFLAWRLAKPGFRIAKRTVGRDPLPLPALLRIGWNGFLGLRAYAGAREDLRQARIVREARNLSPDRVAGSHG